MKETIKNFSLIGLLVAVFILLFLQLCKKPPTPENEKPYWLQPGFKPETLKVDHFYYPKMDSFKWPVPPKQLIEYRIIPQDPNTHLKCNTDSLVELVDSMGKELAKFDKRFLSQYPLNHKLIMGYFKYDSIKLDLLSTDGRIHTEIYPTDFTKYKYLFKDNKMSADEVKYKNSQTKKFNSSLFANVGYMPLTSKPNLTFDYYLRYKRFQFNAEGGFTVEQKPSFLLNGKLGFQVR